MFFRNFAKGACIAIISSHTQPLVSCYPTYDSVSDSAMKESVVIVIDVLRATSTMVTALANGAKEVLPVQEVDDAMALYRRLGPEQALLGGERGAMPIDGFHLSNSPLDYTQDRLLGKSIILTTTNGTHALYHARLGKVVLVGALLNAQAVARAALMWDMPVVLLCAGTMRHFSADDVLCAGAIADALVSQQPSLRTELDDLSRLAMDLFDRHRDHPIGALSDTRHYRRLIELGLNEDIRYCMQRNLLAVVPQYSQGAARLIALDNSTGGFV